MDSNFNLSQLVITEILISDELTQSQFELLYCADPDENKVKEYLARGRVFIVLWQQLCIAIAVLTQDQESCEIKNIAVEKKYRNKGVGKLLLQQCQREAKKLAKSWLIIATGNSSLNQLALYQKCGFRIDAIEKDFFADYPQPIFENGIRCLDKIMLKMPITNN